MSDPRLTVGLVEHTTEEGTMIIDCQRCEVRGIACANCAATVLVADQSGQHPPELGPAELRALAVLANAGMIPPLRYARRVARAS